MKKNVGAIDKSRSLFIVVLSQRFIYPYYQRLGGNNFGSFGRHSFADKPYKFLSDYWPFGISTAKKQ